MLLQQTSNTKNDGLSSLRGGGIWKEEGLCTFRPGNLFYRTGLITLHNVLEDWEMLSSQYRLQTLYRSTSRCHIYLARCMRTVQWIQSRDEQSCPRTRKLHERNEPCDMLEQLSPDYENISKENLVEIFLNHLFSRMRGPTAEECDTKHGSAISPNNLPVEKNKVEFNWMKMLVKMTWNN